MNYVNYNTDRGLNRNIEVLDGGVLTISSEIVMANCKIKVRSGGTLIVDGGRLLHADLELEAASNLVVRKQRSNPHETRYELLCSNWSNCNFRKWRDYVISL